MMNFRKIRPMALGIIGVLLALGSAPVSAQSKTGGGSCPNCGTTVENNVTVNVDLTALADALKKSIEGLIALGLKPSVVYGNNSANYNSGIINNGAWNSGVMQNSFLNTGIYNTGSNNLNKMLAGGVGGGGGGSGSGGGGGGGGGIGGGLKPCGSGTICGRRW